jgi:hypothetical protein
MALLFRLLLNPKTARAFYYWMMGIWVFAEVFVGEFNLDKFQRWLWSSPQEQQQIRQENPPSEEVEALFGLFQHYMDTQHEVNALRNQMLILPALSDEGY